jgi:endoglucanase
VSLIGAASLHAAQNAAVRVDQVGYLPPESKYGMVAGGTPTGAFDIRRVSDSVSVFNGTLAAAFTDADSGDSIRTADFSSLTSTGSYYLDVAGVGQSYNFDINASAFSAAYLKAVRGFYGQRCGIAVNLGTVDGVAYSHPICHTSGTCSDNPSTYHASSGKSGTKVTTGGWHDAGDYGKYIVNSGISTGELLWTWDWWSDRLAGVSSNIPESGNGTPDVLNEARWNLQWMLSMQDTDGGVWHKNTSAGFGSFVLPNLDDAGTRYIIGNGSTPYKTSCSTADFAAVMAIAARLFQPYDATFSATCLTAAQNAWTWVTANPTVYFTGNPSGISTGAYGSSSSTGERLWAAAELFRTTGNATYNSYVTANAPASPIFGTGLQQDWANVRNLGMWAYYFSGQASANASLVSRIKTDMLSAASTIASRTNGTSNGYKVSLSGSGQYIWGSNGAVANYAIFLLVADRMQTTAAYSNAALNDLHYLLGRNTFNTSYVTHVGSKPFLHPHHRPSGSSAYSGGAPWPGLLSGGPNFTGSTSGDGTTPANPYPAKCWIDAQAAYASNEIAINWQAPLVFLLAYTLPTPTTSTPTPSITPTATPTRTPSGTPSITPTPSPSASPSATPSLTPSATRSATGTASPTVTPSASGTLTATSTASPSATRSVTASATPSITPSSTRSSTRTATATASPTQTPSASPSISPSWTASPLASDTASPTISPSWTASRSATPSATPSASPTITPTATATATPSSSPTASPSFTASPPVSPTDSPTPTPSWSASPTASITPTASPSVTPSPLLSHTPTATPSATPSITLTASPGPTAGASSDGPLHIPDAAFHPNPVLGPSLELRFALDGPADRVQLKIYSRAMNLVARLEASGSYSAGWNRANFTMPDLGPGAWFATVHAYQGSKQSLPRAPLKLFKLN